MILLRLRPTFKMMAIAIRLVSMMLPPAVIKGRGSPVMGMNPSVMPTLMIRWKKKIPVAPVREECAIGVFSHSSYMEPAPEDNHEESEHNDRTKEPEFFGYDGKNEVSMIRRQEVQRALCTV